MTTMCVLWFLLVELDNWLQHHVVTNFTESDQADPFAFPQSIQSKQKSALNPDYSQRDGYKLGDVCLKVNKVCIFLQVSTLFWPHFVTVSSRCELGIILLQAATSK